MNECKIIDLQKGENLSFSFGSGVGGSINPVIHSARPFNLKEGDYYNARSSDEDSSFFFVVGKGFHREDGPAMIQGTRIGWMLNGHFFTFENFCKVLNKTDEEILMLILVWSEHEDMWAYHG